MICITIAQDSRRLALADMLNAAMLGADLIEVRLDRFEKDANLGELISAKRKPVLFSCKRKEDGGKWEGTEDERLILLRAAVIAKADYVEIELDAADSIRPFPGCKRVISFTDLKKTPRDIGDIYKEMQTKKPDVIKLTCKASTPEEAWPLIQILNKPPVPTVVEGLGPMSAALSLLGRKIGAPWATAALEKGMEAFAGQPTVRDLDEIYRYRDIGKPTRFACVTGEGERARVLCALINSAFVSAEQPIRVLPMQIGSLPVFKKIADAVRLQGVLLEGDSYEGLHEIAAYDDTSKTPVMSADSLFPSDAGWSASNLLGTAVTRAIESALITRGASENPLRGRAVMLAGVGSASRMCAAPLKAAGAPIVWAGKSRDAVQSAAQSLGGRQILWEGIYATTHEVLVLARDGNRSDGAAGELLHPGYLKPSMLVVDLQAGLKRSKFLEDARVRSVGIVEPRSLLVELARAFTARLGVTIERESLVAKLDELFPEEE